MIKSPPPSTRKSNSAPSASEMAEEAMLTRAETVAAEPDTDPKEKLGEELRRSESEPPKSSTMEPPAVPKKKSIFKSR